MLQDFPWLLYIAPDPGETILKSHLYASDLRQIIPTSEKRALDLSEDFATRA